jgi:hypothetical protein
MNLAKFLTITVLAALALFAGKPNPSGLGFTCDAGTTTSGGCLAGKVTFTGTDYPNHVHVIVTTSSGTVMDDGFYQSPGGILSFTEVLNPAGSYTITTSVHGGHEMIDNFTVTTH